MLYIALPKSQGSVYLQVNADGRIHLEKWLVLLCLFAYRSICKASYYSIPIFFSRQSFSEDRTVKMSVKKL